MPMANSSTLLGILLLIFFLMKLVPGASTNSPGYDVIDEWGRPIPDPGRWPSSAGGKGFKAVADRVHQMGLKFGIHVMRGISTQAVNANTLILGPNGQPYQEGGRIWRAGDIGSKEAACKWMPACFMSVNFNMGGASAAFLRSLYQQYADWGVDFVKHDCVFGDDLELDEITTVSQILKNIDRPIVYSISPGTNVTPRMALQINSLVNMYRVTSDDWDTWQDVEPHFNVARDFAFYQYIGAQGLRGKSWPDLDMLPFGKLSNVGSNEGPHRTSNLTLDEQKTQVTLWAMAKSPLMFGGDLRNVDNTTLGLITNPTVLDINAYSTKNKEEWELTHDGALLNNYARLCTSVTPIEDGSIVSEQRAWVASGKKGEIYVSFFNLSPNPSTISTKVEDVVTFLGENKVITKNKGMSQSISKCRALEVWSGQKLGVINDTISMEVSSHGCALLEIDCD
eukprot:Gb_16622 [translate_table: standard]